MQNIGEIKKNSGPPIFENSGSTTELSSFKGIQAVRIEFFLNIKSC
jgi:hypothetical protein